MDYPVDIKSKIIIQRTYQTGFNMGLLNVVSLKLNYPTDSLPHTYMYIGQYSRFRGTAITKPIPDPKIDYDTHL